MQEVIFKWVMRDIPAEWAVSTPEVPKHDLELIMWSDSFPGRRYSSVSAVIYYAFRRRCTREQLDQQIQFYLEDMQGRLKVFLHKQGLLNESYTLRLQKQDT
jgi:hypothetical protein